MKVESHPDIEYLVRVQGVDNSFRLLRDAIFFGFSTSLVHQLVLLDVLVWSEEGARAFAGEDGATRYLQNPEAPFFKRYEMRAWDHDHPPRRTDERQDQGRT